MEKDALLKAIIWDIETNDKGVVRSITAKFDRHTKGTGQGHLFPPDISADDKTRAEELSREFQRFLRTIGFSNLTDKYEVRQKLGKGKFGLVRLGIDKNTQRKVAIKIMNTKEMNNQDLELVKTEIEILKVCQQPNIIRLYDVYENLDYIYIGK